MLPTNINQLLPRLLRMRPPATTFYRWVSLLFIGVSRADIAATEFFAIKSAELAKLAPMDDDRTQRSFPSPFLILTTFATHALLRCCPSEVA